MSEPVRVHLDPDYVSTYSACWYGSGRKYKQCCRRHGLGELD